MKNAPLPQPEPPRLILSFDFDGTLHEPRDGWILGPDFFVEILRLRAEYDAIWTINTGRSLFQAVEGFRECAFPFLPDMLIAREREIYRPNALGRWQDMGTWNKNCQKAHAKLFKKSRRVLGKIKQYIESETQAKWIEQDDEPAGIIASSNEEMDAIAVHIDEICAKAKQLSHERNTIYMRFSHCDYNKGTALKALAESFDLAPEQTFATGDGHNDLPKLDPAIAKYLACPDNAVPEVKARIVEGNGIIASLPAAAGVMQALRTFFPPRA